MAQINDQGQVYDWGKIGLDKYLRNSTAPLLYDDPVTVRGVLGGAQTIQNSGNVMPQSINRDKLGKDALLFPLNVNVGSNLIQAATGYVSALNNYLFVAQWDGVNYKIIRFNTVNLLAPYQDAYILNTGIGLSGAETVSSIDALTVTDVHVIVAYTTDAGNKYAARLQFDFTYVDRHRAPTYDISLTKGADYDGKNLFSLTAMANPGIEVQQINQQAESGFQSPPNADFNHCYYQKFKTGPSTTQISKISLWMHNHEIAGGNSMTIAWRLMDSSLSTTLASGSFGVGTTGQGWFDQSFSAVTVTPNTTYAIAAWYSSANISSNIYWGKSTGTNYADGNFYYYNNGTPQLQTGTACFKVWSVPPTGYSGNQLVSFNEADYTLAAHISWTPTNLPTMLATYDGQFHYSYDSANKNVVKFTSSTGSIVVATTTPMLESVYGIFYFNEFVFIVALIGSQLVAIPVTI